MFNADQQQNIQMTKSKQDKQCTYKRNMVMMLGKHG
jgi:hypothetical protein